MKIIITETQLNELINKNLLNENRLVDFKITDFLNKNYIRQFIHTETDKMDTYLGMFSNEYELDDDTNIEDVFNNKNFIEFIEETLNDELREIRNLINENIFDGKITLFKLVNINDNSLEQLNKNLGVRWSWEYETFNNENSQSKTIIVETDIDEKNINWQATFHKILYGDINENEIVLQKNIPIKISQIYSNNKKLDISEIKDKIFYA